MSLAKAARATFERGYALCTRRGIATWDPFDVKGCPFALWTYQGRGRAAARKALYAADLLAPKATRQLLGLKPVPSAGGVARWLQANLSAAKLGHDVRGAAPELVAWLVQDARPGPVGHGWGLPFDWQAFVVVPAGTPIGHTTMAVLNALMDAAAQGVAVPAGVVESGLDFLSAGLNRTERASGTIALSYTPLDRSQVVNTNAEIGAVLARGGRSADRPLAESLLRFAVEAQNADGSWFYSAPDAGEGRQVVDNYHTGMILTALMSAVAQMPELAEALARGWRFHLDSHFEPDGCPRMRPHTRWPVDAYSAGESLLALLEGSRCALLPSEMRDECAETADRLVGYIVREMSYADGGFVYRHWRWRKMRLDSLRWADALLCQSLAEYCLARP